MAQKLIFTKEEIKEEVDNLQKLIADSEFFRNRVNLRTLLINYFGAGAEEVIVEEIRSVDLKMVIISLSEFVLDLSLDPDPIDFWEVLDGDIPSTEEVEEYLNLECVQSRIWDNFPAHFSAVVREEDEWYGAADFIFEISLQRPRIDPPCTSPMIISGSLHRVIENLDEGLGKYFDGILPIPAERFLQVYRKYYRDYYISGDEAEDKEEV